MASRGTFSSFSPLCALVFFLASMALADTNTAGWSLGVGCPVKGAKGTGGLLVSRSSGFGAAGSCERTAALFSKVVVSTSGGGTLRSSTVHALQTPSVLITPPLLNDEYQPVFSVASACPTKPGTTDLNWIFVQWTPTEQRQLTNTYLLGSAQYSATSGLFITGQYDVDGSAYWLSNVPMPGSCNPATGIYNVASGEEDILGNVYFTSAGMGAFKTSAGRATFFFPAMAVTLATDLGGQTFRGVSFDSSSANGVTDVRHVRVDANGAGDQFVVVGADPDTFATGGSTYTDTIDIASANTPKNGVLLGSVTRTGGQTGSGNIACLVNTTDGETLVVCSGESPGAPGTPYNITFYREHVHNPATGFGGTVNKISLATFNSPVWVAGDFTNYGGERAQHIARFSKTGVFDTTLGIAGATDDAALTVLSLGTQAYVGGQYYGPGLYRANADGTRDSAFDIGTGFNSGRISSLTADASNNLFVGGSFTHYDGTQSQGLVKLNSVGARDTTFAVGTGFNGDGPYDIDYSITYASLYVAGDFSTYQGSAVPSSIVRLDPTTAALDTAFVSGAFDNGPLRAVRVSPVSNVVYVGGTFTDYDGNSVGNIVRLTATGAYDTAFVTGTGFNGDVHGIAMINSTACVVGDFTSYNGTPVGRLACLDSSGALTSGTALGTGFDRLVRAVAVNPVTGEIFAGGDFTSYNGTGVGRFAMLDSSGVLLTTPTGSGLNDVPVGFAFDSARNVYLAGAFTTYNGHAAKSLVRVKPDGSYDPTFDTSNTFDDRVFVVAVDEANGWIYAGGSFMNVEGVSRQYIARLSLADGSRDATFAAGSGPTGWVDSLDVDLTTGKFYVGGGFGHYDSNPTVNIARANADGSFDATFVTGTGVTGSGVHRIVVEQPTQKIYIGGDFSAYNGTSSNYIARLNVDGSLDSSFVVGSGFDQRVRAITIDPTDGSVYVGGDFAMYNGAPVSRVVRLTVTGALDTTFDPGTGPNDSVTDLDYDPANRKLYVSGWMSNYDGVETRGALRINYDGTKDETFAIGTGLRRFADWIRLEPATGKIYIGGDLTEYFNGAPVDYFVRLNNSGAVD